jgi:iron complex transport system substrate-binding protein
MIGPHVSPGRVHLPSIRTDPMRRIQHVRSSPKPFVVSVVLLVCLMLAACTSPPAEAPAPSSEPAVDHVGIVVVDALGRTVQFAEPPRRIVVAGKSSLTIVETLYLFPQAAERLAGLVVGRQSPGDFLGFVDPTFEGKAVLEVEAGPEQIAPLHPDVVILRSFMAEKLGKPLEQLDIPVVYVDLETPEQYFRDMVTLGQLLGEKGRVEEIRSFYQARLDRVSEGLQGLADDEKPRVLIVQYTDQGSEVALNIPSAAWLQTTEAELAGGSPVWVEASQGGGWTVVNFEQIAAWDPDQIYVISYQADPTQVVQELAADLRWQALRAVQEGKFYGFAADIFSWDQPDPRWILGVTWLASKIHPDRFSDLDMMDEISGFFGQMYGLDQAAIQAHILPNLKGSVE